MGTSEMGDHWDWPKMGGSIKRGTNEKGDQWVQIMLWGTYQLGNQWEGDQWDGGPMRWGTNEMGGQWDGGPFGLAENAWTNEKGDQWEGGPMSSNNVVGDLWIGGPMRRGPMRWGTNESGGPMRWGTNEMGGAWVLIGGPMRWGTNEMGDQWDGGLMRWGTNEMGDQWCAPHVFCLWHTLYKKMKIRLSGNPDYQPIMQADPCVSSIAPSLGPSGEPGSPCSILFCFFPWGRKPAWGGHRPWRRNLAMC